MSGSNDRRWSLARATEFFSGDGKPDMYVACGCFFFFLFFAISLFKEGRWK